MPTDTSRVANFQLKPGSYISDNFSTWILKGASKSYKSFHLKVSLWSCEASPAIFQLWRTYLIKTLMKNIVWGITTALYNFYLHYILKKIRSYTWHYITRWLKNLIFIVVCVGWWRVTGFFLGISTSYKKKYYFSLRLCFFLIFSQLQMFIRKDENIENILKSENIPCFGFFVFIGTYAKQIWHRKRLHRFVCSPTRTTLASLPSPPNVN